MCGTLKIFKFLLMCFVLLCTSFTAVHADIKASINLTDIRSIFKEMEGVLNQKSDLSKRVSFLHNFISDNATFTVKISNPTMPKATQGQVIEMSKGDYINTFIQGTNFVENYHLEITVQRIEINAKSGEAISTHTFVESGLMMNPFQLHKPGQDFISRTKCISRHGLKNGQAVLLGSECRTDVSFAEQV